MKPRLEIVSSSKDTMSRSLKHKDKMGITWYFGGEVETLSIINGCKKLMDWLAGALLKVSRLAF